MLNANDINEFLLYSRALEDAQILLVDNDCDTRALYAFLLKEQGAMVTESRSIQGALDFLDGYIPNFLICEMSFLGESVLPLIQRVKALAFSSGRLIPILVISTCDPISLTQQLTEKVEGYLLKPIDIENFVDQVRHLSHLPNPVYPPIVQSWELNQNPVKRLCCAAGVT